MSLFISDYLTPRHSSGFGLNCSACQHCCRRKDCPYSCDRVFEKALRYAADQGNTTAQLLKEETKRFLKSMSGADDVACLLRADEALENTLTDVLHAEICLIKRISGC